MTFGTSGPVDLGAWLTLALINAGLAESKGRGRLQWFLVSLIVGPVATLLVVTWPRASRPTPEALHPVASTRDRYLLAATVAMVVVVFGAVIAVAEGVWGQDARSAAVAAGVAVLAAVGFTAAIRAYNRRAPRQTA